MTYNYGLSATETLKDRIQFNTRRLQLLHEILHDVSSRYITDDSRRAKQCAALQENIAVSEKELASQRLELEAQRVEVAPNPNS